MAVHDQSLELEQGTYFGKDDNLIRTGTMWTCVAHVITAVIGSGVLSLAWATAQLGWIAGPIAMFCFAIVTYVSAFLLSDCYRSPDPVTGRRNPSYIDAVRALLGTKNTWACGCLQYLSMYGTAIAYTITTGISMREILKATCFHKKGNGASCAAYGDNIYMLIFGVVQVVCSQIPDFHNMAWLSVVAALMSFSYAFIGLGLGLTQAIGNGTIKGSFTGITEPSGTEKLWKITQALGDIAFSFPFSMILLEIENTLKSPPAENKTMKKASMASVCITTFFYLCCGCFGYAAFGDNTPGNLLTGFLEPFWLINFANACIIVHLVGGYQVYSQPVFAFVDRWFANNFPDSGFINTFYSPLPFCKSYQVNLLRLCFRTIYVVTTTGVAMLFPYFNQVLGLLGAINFWPMAIYFPVEMYVAQKKIRPWTQKWLVLRIFSLLCFCVSLVALAGSAKGIISAKMG